MERLIQVIERHKVQLFGYARRLLNRMSVGATVNADDVLSEVALLSCQKVIRAPDAIPHEDPQAIAWLMRAVLYTCMNHARRYRNERRAPGDPDKLLQEHAILSAVEENTAGFHSALDDFLRELDPADRNLLRMYFREGLTSTEIGARLGIEPAAVRQAKSRLLKKLRKKLK